MPSTREGVAINLIKEVVISVVAAY